MPLSPSQTLQHSDDVFTYIFTHWCHRILVWSVVEIERSTEEMLHAVCRHKLDG